MTMYSKIWPKNSGSFARRTTTILKDAQVRLGSTRWSFGEVRSRDLDRSATLQGCNPSRMNIRVSAWRYVETVFGSTVVASEDTSAASVFNVASPEIFRAMDAKVRRMFSWLWRVPTFSGTSTSKMLSRYERLNMTAC